MEWTKMTEKVALTVSETAAALGVSRPTVYKLLRRADFPGFRVGSRQLVSREGLARWVAEQAERGESA
jgi:excisionase family DNA binding protein